MGLNRVSLTNQKTKSDEKKCKTPLRHQPSSKTFKLQQSSSYGTGLSVNRLNINLTCLNIFISRIHDINLSSLYLINCFYLFIIEKEKKCFNKVPSRSQILQFSMSIIQ